MYRIFLFDHWINVEDRLSGMQSVIMIFFVISKRQRQTVLMFVNVGRLPPHEDRDSMDVCLIHNYQHWEFCFYLFVKLNVENGTLAVTNQDLCVRS